MNTMKAISLIDGLEEPDDEETLLKAWQFLIDNGEVWRLQGTYGRIAHAMIESGTLRPPNTKPTTEKVK